jgi:pyruvate dehydrogenase phosphatase
VVYNNRLYCGNAGDSLAILVNEDSPMGFTELNRELNANNPDEQQRLKAQFPGEEDVVVCKGTTGKSCYIKGRLQPSRSIGDFRLKYPEFNNPNNYPPEMEYQSPLKNFSGNYISAIPEVTAVDITPKHRWVVMASDGLWDQLGRQEVAEVFRKNPVGRVPSVLITKCL